MGNTYRDIFNQRGNLYNQAMAEYLGARDEEFAPLLELLQIQSSDIVADIPSGGCYLKPYLPEGTLIYSVDPSEGFLADGVCTENVINAEINQIPLSDESVDKVYSLSGIHHLVDKKPFFREMYRLLKPGGLFGLSDVAKDSIVDPFLNQFVNEHNTQGHVGIFLDNSTAEELKECGFEVISSELKSYTWNFDDRAGMVHFCQLLFGLNKGSDEEIEKGIEHYLGSESKNGKVAMHWELLCILAKKPDSKPL